MFLFISGGEIFVILLVAIMVFGADKLPEIARELGKGMRQIKDATNDIKREIKNSAEKNDLDIDIASKVRNEVSRIKDNFDDFSNPMKKVTKDIENSLNPLKEGDGNLTSYFNQPKEIKKSTTDIATESKVVENSINEPKTPTKETKEIVDDSTISVEKVKDLPEDYNGPIKRES